MKRSKQIITFENLVKVYGNLKGGSYFYLRYANRNKYYNLLKKDLYLKFKSNVDCIEKEIKNLPVTKICGSDKIIWFLWYQGKNDMPKVVANNYKQLQKVTESSDFKIIFLDKNNISDYLTLPKYILKKVNKGKITVTHFSDILRAGLLFNYGGIWIDSTCYIIKDEFDKITHYSFYTQKYKPNISNFFNEGKWSGFFMGAGKNNPFEYFLYNIFLSYWKKYDTLVDYFLIDIFISIGYENINLIKEMIDKVPYNNSDIMIANQINAKNEVNIENINKDTWIIKLDWRKDMKVRNE